MRIFYQYRAYLDDRLEHGVIFMHDILPVTTTSAVALIGGKKTLPKMR